MSVSVSASASASAAVAGDESNEGGKVAVRTDWIPMKEWVTTPEFLVGASVQVGAVSGWNCGCWSCGMGVVFGVGCFPLGGGGVHLECAIGIWVDVVG